MSKLDWARKKVMDKLHFHLVSQYGDELAINLLHNEHRRCVRVVAQVKAKMHENIVANKEWIGCKLDRCYLQACDDLLAALRKGR